MGILVLASLVLITVSFRSSALDGVQSTGATVLKPFEVAADRVTRPFRDTVSWFHGLVVAKNENKKLRVQVAELTRQHILDETAIEQNAQLQAELNYKGPPSIADYDKVFTEVLANPQNDLEQSVTIAAGSADGVIDGALVVQPIGGPAGTGPLIGTVSKVLKHVSRVMLLTDPQSGVTAMDLTDPSAIGIVRRGSGDSLILDRVPKQPTVRVGDTIITAGTIAGSEFGSRYPRAIPIGTVSSQSNTDANLFQLIQVKPLVDLTDVHSVAVLVPKPQK